MADIKLANTLVRGDHINISAAMDASLGETDERFYWDGVESSDGIADATVEGVESSQSCTTVYTDFGTFSVPDDFPFRINSYSRGS
ncbi:hypothetical protein [Gordonia sihwensis]|uniref:hypothetical protein n=1 Tax=Gordonia sihwensis TaxID=173559 RepID=UPI003D98696D